MVTQRAQKCNHKTYGAYTSTVRILTAQPILSNDHHFNACDSLTDTELWQTDSDSDGIPGGHFVRDFSLHMVCVRPSPYLKRYTNKHHCSYPTVSRCPSWGTDTQRSHMAVLRGQCQPTSRNMLRFQAWWSKLDRSDWDMDGIWRFTNTMPSTTIDYGFN